MAQGLRNRTPIPRRPRRDSRLDDLQNAMKTTTDYMGQVRKGLAADWDVGDRQDIIRGIVLPKHERWRGLQDPYLVNSRPPRVYRDRFIFANAIPSSPGRLPLRAQARLGNARNIAFGLSRNLAPAHITFRKILGYGGFGVAALFGLHDSTGKEVKVVVKADLRSNPGILIQTEKNNMTLMSGAKHVVQRTLLTQFPWPKDIPERYDYAAALLRVIVKLPIFLVKVVFLFLLTLTEAIIFLVELVMGWEHGEQVAEENANHDPADDPGLDQPAQPPGPIPSMASWRWSQLWPDQPTEPQRHPGIDAAIRRNRQDLDNRQDIICMEFLKFGDLAGFIGKMTQRNNNDPRWMFSERVAWTIFECLWRGCVALAHPAGFYQDKDPLTTQIPQVTESSEGSTVNGRDPMVHFDLDPSNVFVGDFAPDHASWPLTKIGDLGLSLQPRSQTFEDRIDEEIQRWLQRRRGKRDFYLPEQMTEQWDFVPGLNSLRNHHVCGNYGAHSNLYHIGLTMFELLTLNKPDEPPFSRPYAFTIDRKSLSGWTYGHNLLWEYNPAPARQYSAELRHTVAWCMEHNPFERPSLNRLGQIIHNHLAANPPDQPADATRNSAGNLMGHPLPPRAR